MVIVGKLRNILPWCQRVIFSFGVCGHRWVVSFSYLCCVHPRPQTQQGESLAKHETPLLITLSIACKHEVYGNLFSPLFEKKSPRTKHPREVVKNRNSIPHLSQYITSKDCQHPVSANQCPRRAGHHRPSLFHQQTHKITYNVRYQGSKYTIKYIHSYKLS